MTLILKQFFDFWIDFSINRELWTWEYFICILNVDIATLIFDTHGLLALIFVNKYLVFYINLSSFTNKKKLNEYRRLIVRNTHWLAATSCLSQVRSLPLPTCSAASSSSSLPTSSSTEPQLARGRGQFDAHQKKYFWQRKIYLRNLEIQLSTRRKGIVF